MNIDSATPSQREAIITDDPNVLCIAGPGSGKTATLVARIERLIKDGAKPSEITVLTFTNAAAREFESRLSRQLEPVWAIFAEVAGVKEEPKLGFTGTLHSFALRMLKEHGTPFGYGDRVALISPDSAADLIVSKAKTVNCKTPIKDLLALKAKGRPPRTARLTLAETVVASYLDDLKDAGVVDYDVLLQEFRDMLTSGTPAAMSAQLELRDRFTYLFVDERQDSAVIDSEIYRALPMAMKFFVGDSDQAIYSFRGGAVGEMIAESQQPGVRVIRLEENFRSHAEICAAANSLIGHNTSRIPKLTQSVKGDGGSITVFEPMNNEGEEIGEVCRAIRSAYAADPDASVAVLTFTNALADAFRKTLAATGIPVVDRKVSQLPRDWSFARAFVELLGAPDNDALAFFYLVALYEKEGAPPKDARDAAHAVRKAAASVGKSINQANLHLGRVKTPALAIQALHSQPVSKEAKAIVAERFNELPVGANMLDFALSLGDVREHVTEGEGAGVRCLTIHGSKGREFDHVFLVGFEDESIPGRGAKGTLADLEEMRRLAYVAVTRAKRYLYLSFALSRVTAWGAIVNRTPSRFIPELVESWKYAPVSIATKGGVS